MDFANFEPGLHPLVLRALASLEITKPTRVQEAVLSAALGTSRDILARAPTGSGKTLAYGIPILEGVLRELESENRPTVPASKAKSSDAAPSPTSLVLVPTRELSAQVCRQLGELVSGTGLPVGTIQIADACAGDVRDTPQILVGTPARVLALLRAATVSLVGLRHLVIDEADLLLSYGHSLADVASVLGGPWAAASAQRFVVSATVTADVEALKGVVLTEPVVVELEEEAESHLTEFYVRCSEEDKFLLLYVVLKLRLISGKSLVFVNDTDRAYRVKLFLEKFGIKTGVLNAELPFNSRYHAVEAFNRGVFDYLIAVDEHGDVGDEGDGEAEGEGEADSKLIAAQVSEETAEAPKKKSAKKQNKKDTSYGVARGVDFIDVACVINFDLPPSVKAYTHRVGRTARAGRTGTSLSFVVPKDQWGKLRKYDISLPSAKKDEKVWGRITAARKAVREYAIDPSQVDGFRYRMHDALRSVTKAAVREARVKELKNEILISEKLKAHFEDNPQDLQYLRHDRPLHPSRVQPHLQHVPSYLLPRVAPMDPTSSLPALNSINVPFHKNKKRQGTKKGNGKGKRRDPLKGGKLKLK